MERSEMPYDVTAATKGNKRQQKGSETFILLEWLENEMSLTSFARTYASLAAGRFPA
jgi:hypothetical protein